MLRRTVHLLIGVVSVLAPAVAVTAPAVAAPRALVQSDPDLDAYCNYQGSIIPGPPRDLQALDAPPVANRANQTFSFRTGLCFGNQYKREAVVVRWVGTGATFAQVEAEIARRPDAFHVFSCYRDGKGVLVANNYYRSTG